MDQIERPFPLRVRIECIGLTGGNNTVTLADSGEELACTRIEYVFDAKESISRAVLYCAAAHIAYEGEADIICVGCPHGDEEKESD